LNELKHPNIIELLSSYTYRGKHNFLFPLAQGDLAEFLTSNERPPQFQPDRAFYTALRELSSAIGKVHHYTSARLKLDLIGCHHDLRPQNILVGGSTFLLADFGLSAFTKSTTKVRVNFFFRWFCFSPWT
jgi:serine/threonine protein kinase